MPIISCFPTKVENDDRYLRLIGGTMQGNINMDGSKVTGLGAPSDPTDAVRQQDLAVLSDEIDQVIAGTTPIVMPAATEAKAGAVKIGEGLSVTEDGTIAVKSDAVPAQGSANAAQSGGVYTALTSKQDKLSGTKGQLVGFDDDGNAVPQAAPDTGVVTFNGRTGTVTPQAGDYTAAMVSARSDDWLPSTTDIGAVPTGRKVNGYELTGDITLEAEDVGARPVSWTPTAADVGAIPAAEKGAASGVATLGTDGRVPASQLPQMDYIPTSMKGANSGVAELDGNGKVPTAQLPSYVDDVLEYANRAAFPDTGETGKIYVALDTNLTYRWGGTEYVEISASLALGETGSTAYRGDRGAAAYAHSQIAQGNPHGTTAEDVGAMPAVSGGTPGQMLYQGESGAEWGDKPDAQQIDFTPGATGLTADNVQGAIEELNEKIPTGGLPVSISVLETICENVELTDDSPSHTFAQAITIDESALYWLEYRSYSADGTYDATNSFSGFSRKSSDTETEYVRWLSASETNSVTMTQASIADTWRGAGKKSVLTILKVSVEITDEADFCALNMEGFQNNAPGQYSHVEGKSNTASGIASHAEGQNTIASGSRSHAGGSWTTASGNLSFAHGNSAIQNGESFYTEAIGESSIALGAGVKATETAAFAEGFVTTASGQASHAEGQLTIASGIASHAEGLRSTASGDRSHAEGSNTIASGDYSHAEGRETIASNFYAHAEGRGTVAASNYQHAQGKWNIEDSEGKYADIVGNGSSDTSRSNAYTLDWDGNACFAGDVYAGGADMETAEKLARVPKSVTVTLPASGWSSNTQTVTVSGVLADESAQLIQPMPAIASQNAYITAGVICSGQGENQLTFTCSTTPTEDISLYVVITEVSA